MQATVFLKRLLPSEGRDSLFSGHGTPWLPTSSTLGKASKTLLIGHIHAVPTEVAAKTKPRLAAHHAVQC